MTIMDPEKKVRADALRVGDRVDLFGDLIADPDRDPGNSYEFEFVMVDYIERETADCILIGFEGGNPVGFPPDHALTVSGHDDTAAYFGKSVVAMWRESFAL